MDLTMSAFKPSYTIVYIYFMPDKHNCEITKIVLTISGHARKYGSIKYLIVGFNFKHLLLLSCLIIHFL